MASRQDNRDTDISERLRRIETRVTRLSLAQGVNPFAEEKVFIFNGKVSISDEAVSLGEIRAFMTAQDLESGAYDIYMNGEKLAVYLHH